FGEIGGEPALALGERDETRLVRRLPLRQGALPVARCADAAEPFAHRLPGGALALGGAGGLRRRLLRRRLHRAPRLLGSDDALRQLGESVALLEALRRQGRRAGGALQAIPAPQRS